MKEDIKFTRDLKMIKDLLIVGDSFSFGSGLPGMNPEGVGYTTSGSPAEDCFGKLISDKLRLNYYNISSQGISNDYMVRNFMRWYGEYITNGEYSQHLWKIRETFPNPQELLVIVGLTYKVRWEAWDDETGDWIAFSPVMSSNNVSEWIAHSRKDKENQKRADFRLKYEHSEVEERSRYLNNILTLQSFFQSKNIKYIFFEVDTDKNFHSGDTSSFKATRSVPFDKMVGFEEYQTLINYENFVDWTFTGYINNNELGGYTQCKHPDVKSHKIWADYLIEKIIEIGYGDHVKFKTPFLDYRIPGSQFGQVDYVIDKSNGKTDGIYVEIGAGHPIHINNSYKLEKDYNWKGISIDCEDPKNASRIKADKCESLSVEEYEKFWYSIRKNPIVVTDATTVDYNKLFESYNLPKNIDYLQIDIDPPKNTYQALLNIPFEDYNIKIITYEHDCPWECNLLGPDKDMIIEKLKSETCPDEEIKAYLAVAERKKNIKLVHLRQMAKDYLLGLGYVLDVKGEPEDWYVKDEKND